MNALESKSLLAPSNSNGRKDEKIYGFSVSEKSEKDDKSTYLLANTKF
jgi:hypothetical protein